MKFNKFIVITSLVLLSLVIFLGGISSSASKKKTRTIHYISIIPKSMRGTWYGDNYGNMDTMKISAHSIVSIDPMDGLEKVILHKYVNHDPLKMSKKQLEKTNNWFFMYRTSKKYHGYTWFGRYGWNQTAGAGSFYTVSSYKGHKVLTLGEGADITVVYHSFKSKKLAEKYKHVKLPNFQY